MFNPIDIVEKLDYMCRLYNYLEKINNTRNYKELNELYNYVKVIENRLYKTLTKKNKKFILSIISSAEQCIKDDYLLPYNPKFNLELTYDNIDRDNPESILEYIVNEARKFTYIKNYKYTGIYTDIKDISTENMCEELSNVVTYTCTELGISAEKYKINPAYTSSPKIYNGNGYHYIVFVIIKDKHYLVDCTYSQFFITKYNNLNRLGICHLGNCLAGIYMTMNEERKKVANKILTDGWIEINESNLKDYLDGFTLSYRNGLYYENNNDFSYQTEYNIEDYTRFIRGEDNTVNHEGVYNLGYQQIPLRNPYIKF